MNDEDYLDQLLNSVMGNAPENKVEPPKKTYSDELEENLDKIFAQKAASFDGINQVGNEHFDSSVENAALENQMDSGNLQPMEKQVSEEISSTVQLHEGDYAVVAEAEEGDIISDAAADITVFAEDSLDADIEPVVEEDLLENIEVPLEEGLLENVEVPVEEGLLENIEVPVEEGLSGNIGLPLQESISEDIAVAAQESLSENITLADEDSFEEDLSAPLSDSLSASSEESLTEDFTIPVEEGTTEDFAISEDNNIEIEDAVTNIEQDLAGEMPAMEAANLTEDGLFDQKSIDNILSQAEQISVQDYDNSDDFKADEQQLQEDFDNNQKQDFDIEPENNLSSYNEEPMEIDDLDALDAILDREREEKAVLNQTDNSEEEEFDMGDGNFDGSQVPEELELSFDEIDKLLEDAKKTGDSENDFSTESSVDDILADIEKESDEALNNINDMFENGLADNAESADIYPSDVNGESFDESELDELLADNGAQEGKAKKKGKKDKKSKKEKATKAEGEKKQGLFAKLMALLTEDDEDEEADNKQKVPEADATGITDENKEILEQLEEKAPKKAKKAKKEKPKKEKAKKPAKPKKEKPKKAPKPKKEKKPKPPAPPERKLPKKKVIVTFLFGITVFAAIIIAVFGLSSIINLNSARSAFKKNDFVTTYQMLYGEKMKEEDQALYDKSRTVLMMDRKLSSYDSNHKMGLEAEAVSALLEGIRLYPVLSSSAGQQGVSEYVNQSYNQILSNLAAYGVDETRANEINSYDRLNYTRAVNEIVSGNPNYKPEATENNSQTVIMEADNNGMEDTAVVDENTENTQSEGMEENPEENTADTSDTEAEGEAATDPMLYEGAINPGEGQVDVFVPELGTAD